MSQENVEVCKQVFGAFGVRADSDAGLEEMLAYIDPEIELHSAVVGGAEGNVYRGHHGIRRWFADSMESFEELSTELTEFRDLGDRVLALGRIHARGRESGLKLDSPTGWVLTVRRGRVVKAEGFLNQAQALEVARAGGAGDPAPEG